MQCYNCGSVNLSQELSENNSSNGYVVDECFGYDTEVADVVDCYRCEDCSKVSWITAEDK